MRKYIERLWHSFSESGEAAVRAASGTRLPLPVLWLLGRSGAGKSSLIRELTGLPGAVIGSGFRPCTRCTQEFDFPADDPLMRFLDTRGLDEAGYDPAEDLAQCEAASHLILAVARLDDPAQGGLVATIAAVHKRRPATRVIVVHTGADLVPDPQARFRARSLLQAALESAANSVLPWVELALPPEGSGRPVEGLERLLALLGEQIPEVALLLLREDQRGAERRRFAELRHEVLRYAGAAAASDTAPVLGAVAVPSIQAAMLRRLGRHYDVHWSRARLAEFAMALGLGVALRFGGGYAARQTAKLIPVYGQTVGAAAAGTLSLACTYALGRAACYYLYRVQHGEAVPGEELRAVYQDALKRAFHEKR